ncbi:hypothetical protein HMPREF0379_0125 [[Eubacterium] yurii subsp. margaretiae ATCC 43715]|nr:hypothetical protein HMPREF0379_0125 [[Eubacterium] yurii subsp. margaretiae ATCC 43715]
MTACQSSEAKFKVTEKADVEAVKLVFEAKDLSKEKRQFIIEDKNKKQAATGKYANATPDGKAKWNVQKGVVNGNTPIAEKMFSNISLDGKKITLPMDFKDLGGEFAGLAKFDFTKINEDMSPLIIENEVNKTKLFFLVVMLTGADNVTGVSKVLTTVDVIKNESFAIGVNINPANKKITGLNGRNGNLILSEKDLKVDGIGVGSTFNEMYAKFGNPGMIIPVRDGLNDGVIAMYGCTNKDKSKTYVIMFEHTNKVFTAKGYENTKANVITSVSVNLSEKSK